MLKQQVITQWGKRFLFTCFLSFFWIGNFTLYAQINILGKPGYIKTPSSEWENDSNFSFNFGFLPVESTLNKRFLNRDALLYNTRIRITSYLEVGLNMVYPLGLRFGVGDRQMDVRFLIKKETKSFPALTFVSGLPFRSNHLFTYTALVFTKNFEILGNTKLQLTGGYSSPYYLGKQIEKDSNFGFYTKDVNDNLYLTGFFGGFSWKPVPWVGIMADYDTRDVNAGLWVGYKDRVGLQYHLYGLKNPGGNFYFKVPLDFESRELRRFRKTSKKQGI